MNHRCVHRNYIQCIVRSPSRQTCASINTQWLFFRILVTHRETQCRIHWFGTCRRFARCILFELVSQQAKVGNRYYEIYIDFVSSVSTIVERVSKYAGVQIIHNDNCLYKSSLLNSLVSIYSTSPMQLELTMYPRDCVLDMYLNSVSRCFMMVRITDVVETTYNLYGVYLSRCANRNFQCIGNDSMLRMYVSAPNNTTGLLKRSIRLIWVGSLIRFQSFMITIPAIMKRTPIY